MSGAVMSCEMLSQDGEAFPNILRMHTYGKYVFIEIEAKHDGHKINSVVKVERCVFRYHVQASGVLAP